MKVTKEHHLSFWRSLGKSWIFILYIPTIPIALILSGVLNYLDYLELLGEDLKPDKKGDNSFKQITLDVMNNDEGCRWPFIGIASFVAIVLSCISLGILSVWFSELIQTIYVLEIYIVCCMVSYIIALLIKINI